jgi:hypothetical protein
MWLEGSDIEKVKKMVEGGRVITQEELREVVTLQLRNRLDHERALQRALPGGPRQLVFVGIPLLIMAGVALALVMKYYPRAVFLWGDEVARYETIKQRRKALWGIIGAVLFIGLLSRFFYEGVVPWLPR